MADIVLINPYTQEPIPKIVPDVEKIRFKIPWGIFSIGSVLKSEGYNVKLIDAHAYHYMKKDDHLKSLIKKETKKWAFWHFISEIIIDNSILER